MMGRDVCKKKNKENKKYCLIKAITLNVICLLAMLLTFEPFFINDDFVMSRIVYGANGHAYDYQLLYMNFIYGRLLVLLLKVFPAIPWYTVIFYVLIFSSLTLFSWEMFSAYSDNKTIRYIVIAIVIFFAYEGYIAIQFTKVAGIVAAISAFIWLDRKSNRLMKMWALLLWCFACMVRLDMAKMVLGGWLLNLGLIYIGVVYLERVFSKKHIVDTLLRYTVLWMFFLILPLFSMVGMSDEEKSSWNDRQSYSSEVRSIIQDYPWASYEEAEAVYQKYGLTENDIYIYRSWNADTELVSYEQGKNIHKDIISYRGWDKRQSFVEKTFKTYFNGKRIIGFFKEYPLIILKIDLATVVLLVLLLIFWTTKFKQGGGYFAYVIPTVIFLVLNYYLFIGQRYFQHRVDVGIILFILMVTIYNSFSIQEYSLKECSKRRLVPIAVMVVLVGTYFSTQEDIPVVDPNVIETNREFYKNISQTRNIKYLKAGTRNGGTINLDVYYGVFEVPPIGSNAKLYNVAYSEVIDNKNAYLVLDEKDQNEERWKEYYEHKTGEKNQFILVKRYLGKKLYQIRTNQFEDKLFSKDAVEAEDEIKGDIVAKTIGDKLKVEGRSYLKNGSEFEEIAFLKIVDYETGEKMYYNITLEEDRKTTVGKEGHYSSINALFELPEFFSENDEVFLCLIKDENTYAKRIM